MLNSTVTSFFIKSELCHMKGICQQSQVWNLKCKSVGCTGTVCGSECKNTTRICVTINSPGQRLFCLLKIVIQKETFVNW